LRTPFLDGLAQKGFVVGRNVAIDYRYSEGRDDRLPALAAELVQLPATVLVAFGGDSALAAKNATATIPIVFASGADPVRLGLVASLRRRGGNTTGTSSFGSSLGPKRLELMRDLIPQPRLIAFLFGPATRSNAIGEAETAAQAIGQQIVVLRAQDEAEVQKAFATMAERQVSGLIYGASTYFQVIADKLIALAARYRIPTIYEWPEFVAAGGLMSYNSKRGEGALLAADYVGRILRGAKPADLPVVQSTRFELVINLKTAKALGITVPQSLLARADEVVE
jgi:putative ABC transport system substrate-binding protein